MHYAHCLVVGTPHRRHNQPLFKHPAIHDLAVLTYRFYKVRGLAMAAWLLLLFECCVLL